MKDFNPIKKQIKSYLAPKDLIVGFIEQIEPDCISGWAIHKQGETVTIEFRIKGITQNAQLNWVERMDVAEKYGQDNINCGFQIILSDEARVLLIKEAANLNKAIEITANKTPLPILGSAKSSKLKGRSTFSLFSEGRLEDVFEQVCAKQTGNKTFRQKNISQKLRSLPAGQFKDLGEFHLFVARELLDGIDLDATVPLTADSKLAATSYLAAIDCSLEPSVTCFREAISLLHASKDYEAAEKIVLKAVSKFPEDEGVLLAGARLFAAKKKYSPARFLYGAYAKSSPGAIAAEALVDIAILHDHAYQERAYKIKDLEDFFSCFERIGDITNRESSVSAIETKKKADKWVAEFYELLGNFPVQHLFDVDYYQEQTTRVIASEEQAVLDYFHHGWNEGLSTHRAIDDGYVRRQLISAGKMQPFPLLLLYLRDEVSLKLVPNALVDPERLHTAFSGKAATSPWLSFIGNKKQGMPSISAYFDADYYLEKTRTWSPKLSVAPLFYFLTKDFGTDCNRLFHTGFYAYHYQYLLKGQAPILHYLSEGAYMGCLPNPFCELNLKSGNERNNYLKLT